MTSLIQNIVVQGSLELGGCGCWVHRSCDRIAGTFTASKRSRDKLVNWIRPKASHSPKWCHLRNQSKANAHNQQGSDELIKLMARAVARSALPQQITTITLTPD